MGSILRKIHLCCLLVLLVGSNSVVNAQTTQYSDRTSWQAAVQAGTGAQIQTIDFFNADDGTDLTPNPGEDRFYSALSLKGATFQNVWVYDDINNPFAYSEFPASIRVNLPANVSALAMDLGPVIQNSPGTFTIGISTGEVFSFASRGGGAVSPEGLRDFFGIISTTPIQWIDISYDSINTALDNFSFVAPPAVQTVGIDIVPGSDTNRVLLSSQASVEVAILSSATLDATKVNPSTVRFGRNGTEAAATQYTFKDVNKDGRRDMVLTFRVTNTGIMSGDTVAKLTGRLLSGQNIQGSDAVRTVPSNVKSPF